MVVTAVISICTFVLMILVIIFLPNLKIKRVTISTYWIVALLGAIVILATQQITISEAWQGITSNTSINPLKILILFFSMTFISVFLDEVGFFKFVAVKVANKVSGSQYKLFFALYLLTAILTMFTSNDVVILTFTPFICYFCKNTKINPIPYLVAEFVSANTWSMMFIIGNPTNIYLATTANIKFLDYFKVMAIPTLVAGISEYLLLLLIFKKHLKIRFESSNEGDVAINIVDTIIGLTTLFACLVMLVISSYIEGMEMWLIALICACVLLIYFIVSSVIRKSNLTIFLSPLKRLPYALIPFIISMFIIVISMQKQGISQELCNFFGETGTIYVYGSASFLGANLINNIPMSILFSTIPNVGSPNYLSAIYGSIIGSNIGAFLTPIGALAGIMFTSLVRKSDVKYTFIDFIKYGAIISIPTLFITLSLTSIFVNL